MAELKLYVAFSKASSWKKQNNVKMNLTQWVFMKDALSQMINIIKKVENYNEL